MKRWNRQITLNRNYQIYENLFFYHHSINPNSKLTLVGSAESFDVYKQKLMELSAALKLPVNITGMVSPDELIAQYNKADLFLCMSEHEGFCIPIIEAMYCGIPVIAFDSSAVPETVGNAGVLFKQKHFPSVAHLMNCVLCDIPLQERMKAAGFERAKYFSKEVASKRMIKLIEEYADELGI